MYNQESHAKKVAFELNIEGQKNLGKYKVLKNKGTTNSRRRRAHEVLSVKIHTPQ